MLFQKHRKLTHKDVHMGFFLGWFLFVYFGFGIRDFVVVMMCLKVTFKKNWYYYSDMLDQQEHSSSHLVVTAVEVTIYPFLIQ